MLEISPTLAKMKQNFSKFEEKRIMRTIFNIFIFLFVLSGNSFSQIQNNPFHLENDKSPYVIINWGECFDKNCYWPYDTSSINIKYCSTSNCLWQIGRPLKPNLDTTYSSPNALMTDTLNPYPINTNSSFIINVKKPIYYLNACWSHMLFSLTYKVDVDSFKDGFFVEISYNNTGIWNNIINDQSGDTRNFAGIYSNSDTLFNGEPGISYIQNNMQNWGVLSLDWLWNNPNAHLVDSVMFRITFISDSINNNKSGVLIDFIGVRVDDWCNVGISENKIEELNIRPNPVNSESFIEFDEFSNYIITINDIAGNLIYESKFIGSQFPLGRLNLPIGIYCYNIINNINCFNGKFIIQP